MGDATLSTTRRVTWRGVTVDQRTAVFLGDLAGRVRAYVQPTQGCFNRGGVAASAGTHDGAGAVDLSVRGLTRADEDQIIRAAREMGAAAWLRTAITNLWPRHIHMVMIPPSGSARNDGGLSRGAFSQIRDYAAGRNGLANRGRDDGPRIGITTYEQWRASVTPKPERKEWDTMASKEELKAAFKEAYKELEWEKLSPGNKNGMLNSSRMNNKQYHSWGLQQVQEGIAAIRKKIGA